MSRFILLKRWLPLGLITPNIAFGVCLNDHPTVADEFEYSKLVFTAKVQEVVPVIDRREDFIEGYVYILEVSKFFKGSEFPVAVSYSENSSGRFEMDIGKEYLIFTDNFRNPIGISNCGNSTELSKAESIISQISELGK